MTGAASPRRAFFSASLGAAAGLLLARRAEATDYATAREALDAMETQAAEVVARLRALCGVPGARVFCERLLVAHERQRSERGRLRGRLGLPAAAPAPPAQVDRSLAGLRAAQEALVFAQAEGLPALPDGRAVDLIAHQLVVSARQLTLVDLWIEGEQARA